MYATNPSYDSVLTSCLSYVKGAIPMVNEFSIHTAVKLVLNKWFITQSSFQDFPFMNLRNHYSIGRFFQCINQSLQNHGFFSKVASVLSCERWKLLQLLLIWEVLSRVSYSGLFHAQSCIILAHGTSMVHFAGQGQSQIYKIRRILTVPPHLECFHE